MKRTLDPVLESEDDLTIGRAVSIAAWRYEYKKTRKLTSLVYDINRLRKDFPRGRLGDMTMDNDYSRVSFDMIGEAKADLKYAASDFYLRHPLNSCARIVLSESAGFARLGREVRKAVSEGKTDIGEFLAYLSSVSKD